MFVCPHHACTPTHVPACACLAADSTVLRNLGVGMGHSVLAYQSTLRGIRWVDGADEAMLERTCVVRVSPTKIKMGVLPRHGP